MERLRCIGGCVTLFLVAIAFDIVGLVLIFIGIFANLQLNGRFYGDFLIYTGALVVFSSLAWWIMWYVGNVQVSVDDGSKRTSTIVRLARKLSERLSMKLKGEEGVKCVRGIEDEENSSQVGSPAHKASRVTWGRATAYSNRGYDDSLDSLDGERKAEQEKDEKLDQDLNI